MGVGSSSRRGGGGSSSSSIIEGGVSFPILDKRGIIFSLALSEGGAGGSTVSSEGGVVCSPIISACGVGGTFVKTRPSCNDDGLKEVFKVFGHLEVVLSFSCSLMLAPLVFSVITQNARHTVM